MSYSVAIFTGNHPEKGTIKFGPDKNHSQLSSFKVCTACWPFAALNKREAPQQLKLFTLSKERIFPFMLQGKIKTAGKIKETLARLINLIQFSLWIDIETFVDLLWFCPHIHIIKG